ncbi:MAG: acetoin utilization protein AcuC [Thermodesulfovibrionales bacterium]|nr:acetoin utilization protein AcuC [Thermodesulfovibrionales bacterium]
MRKTAFIYTDRYSDFDYGDAHPLKIYRLKLTYELIKSLGLLDIPNSKFVEARKAQEEELLLFHDKEYLEVLKILNEGANIKKAYLYGFGSGDNPVFKGLLDWSLFVTGASLQAAELVDSNEVNIAFNIAGGLHHALRNRASGFCYVNDPVITIEYLRRRGRKVAYIDIDAHHGDGVQEAFYSTNDVLTISIHETGKLLFPGSGFETEIGSGIGEGYSLNVPLPPFCDDEIFIYAFSEIVPAALENFRPDIIVTQLGVDSFVTDPLAHLNITNNAFVKIISQLKNLSERWVALGGGGYDIINVVKGWTLAWAEMNDIKLSEKLPKEFFDRYKSWGFKDESIFDKPYIVSGDIKEKMKEAVEKTIRFLYDKALSKIK